MICEILGNGMVVEVDTLGHTRITHLEDGLNRALRLLREGSGDLIDAMGSWVSQFDCRIQLAVLADYLDQHARKAPVHGAPEGTAAQAYTARELGYGDDVAAMVADHDPLHARLCDWLGLADSEALFGGRPEVAAAEEAAVLAVQKFMRLAGGRMPGARR